jgi:hypothetical protein
MPEACYLQKVVEHRMIVIEAEDLLLLQGEIPLKE